MAYWLIKSEPNTYAFDQLLKDKKTAWTGIRNYTARNNLRAMKSGDQLLFYHSTVGKEVVGIAKVIKTAYQDPTDKDPAWVCVDIAPVQKLKKSISLEQLKKHPVLKNMQFIKLGRLSVSVVSENEFKSVCALANA